MQKIRINLITAIFFILSVGSGYASVWQSPVSVHSDCSAGSAGNLIDGDTGTPWQHWAREQHWVILDLGDSYTVSGLQKYHQMWTTDPAVIEIYISENISERGEPVGSMPEYYSDLSGWKEGAISAKRGRYIMLIP